jgi:hypothetical protein
MRYDLLALALRFQKVGCTFAKETVKKWLKIHAIEVQGFKYLADPQIILKLYFHHLKHLHQ